MAETSEVEGLFRAVKLEDWRVVEKWCASGGDVNVVDKTYKHSTPLHWAAYTGSEKVTSVLLDFGADVNALESDNKTALHLGAFEGNQEVVEMLVNAGANYRLRDTLGKTPCDVAIMNKHIQVARVLPNYAECVAPKAVSESASPTSLMWEERPIQNASVASSSSSAVRGRRGAQRSEVEDTSPQQQEEERVQPVVPPLSALRGGVSSPAASHAGHVVHAHTPAAQHQHQHQQEVPYSIQVRAGADAYPVEGIFTLAASRTWEGMPLWECTFESGVKGCIYAGTNGLWIVTEDIWYGFPLPCRDILQQISSPIF